MKPSLEFFVETERNRLYICVLTKVMRHIDQCTAWIRFKHTSMSVVEDFTRIQVYHLLVYCAGILYCTDLVSLVLECHLSYSSILCGHRL